MRIRCSGIPYSLPTLFTFYLIICLSGCASLLKKAFIKPKITYEGMQIQQIELTQATILLSLGIDNRNNMDFDITQMEHTVSLGTNRVMETIIKDRVFIKAMGKTIVQFPVDISFLGVKENLIELWKQKNIPYHVTSRLIIESGIGKIPLKFKFEDVIKLPPIPDLTVDDIIIDNISFSNISMIFALRILNNDKIKLNIDELSYDVSFNGFQIAKGKLDTTSFSDFRQSDTDNSILLNIPVNMHLLSLKRSITDMMKNGQVIYNIHLHLKTKSEYGTYILPLDKSGTTKLYGN